MIAVDSSALVAIVLGEHDAEVLLAALVADHATVSVANLVEAAIVVEARQGADAARDLRLLVDGAVDDLRPVDQELGEATVAAWRRFGKGRHPAGLNFGDCFAYALARSLDAPLLFKGDDFGHTDVAIVPV